MIMGFGGRKKPPMEEEIDTLIPNTFFY